MFCKSAPSRADIEHAPAGLDAASLDGGIQFATDGAFQRLVIAFEVAVRVAAVFFVEEEQIEIGFTVVMLVYPLLVAVYLAEEQALSIRRPEINKRMAVREAGA